MESDIYAASQGFYCGSTLQDACREMHRRVINLDLWVDAKCLWGCIISMKLSTEKDC